VATEAAELLGVSVRRAETAGSGFAMIVEQYLQQNLEEFEDRRNKARKLRGRVAMVAQDYDQAVTLVFEGEEVGILDGEAEPLDAAIRGDYQTLVDLIQGDDNPLKAHLFGRIKVRSSIRRPFLPLHVHNLMKLEPEKEAGFITEIRGFVVVAAIAAGLAATLAYLI
jgi:putative sterol carrier protein